MHIGFFACFHAISLERSGFSKIATLLFHALVALNMLVSLISRLVAFSQRIVGLHSLQTHAHCTQDEWGRNNNVIITSLGAKINEC